MAEPAARTAREDGGGQSVGDLVSLMVRDVTRLIRCELDLAKLELRADVRRLGLAAALLAIAVSTACLVLVFFSFALVYGLVAAFDVPTWGSFLIVAVLCILLAVAAGFVVYRKVRRISGLRKTRATVSEDLALLRRDDNARPRRTGTG